MDQVKRILEIVLKYRFWLIWGVILILPVGGWVATTSKLSKEFEERKTAIKGKFDALQTVMGIQNHPNDRSAEGMDHYIDEARNSVLGAWDVQYRKQETILVWPSELGQEFIQQVEKFQPIEIVPYPTPVQQEIPVRFRERYRDYIKEELPKLAETIGSVWRATRGFGAGLGDMAGAGMPGGGMPGMGFGAEAMPGGMPDGGMPGDAAGAGFVPGMTPGPNAPSAVKEIVFWNPQDQSTLQNQRFEWSHYPGKAPKTLDVLYAQEDLWVLKALMQIIARTNKDATGRYNAIVKEIRYVNLGRSVGRTTGRVLRLSGGLTGMGPGGATMPGGEMPSEAMPGGAEGMMSADAMAAPMPADGGMPGDAMGAPMSADAGMPGDAGPGMGAMGMGIGVRSPDPANYRYVDMDYKPIPADRLRQVVTATNPSPEDAFLVVAKRIPIRIGLVMDQRKVHRFISECGNASLMVEVRQVRLNKLGGAGTTFGGGSMDVMGAGMPGGDWAGAGGMMSGAEGGMPGMGGIMPGAEAGMVGGGVGIASGTDRDKSLYDMPVEIYGMIYIYNPVAKDKLAGGTPSAGIAMGSAPAAPAEENPPPAPASPGT